MSIGYIISVIYYLLTLIRVGGHNRRSDHVVSIYQDFGK